MDVASFVLIIVVLAVVGAMLTPDKKKKKQMWEILVPASNKIQEFSFEHHKAWDEFVIAISGGITVMRTAKGEWVSPDNERFKDRMIPVRIKCSRKQIKRIIEFTIKHYDQQAVLAYKISSDVILKNRTESNGE